MREDLEEIYYTKQDIKTRVSELGEQITKVYKGCDEITIISIINGHISASNSSAGISGCFKSSGVDGC